MLRQVRQANDDTAAGPVIAGLAVVLTVAAILLAGVPFEEAVRRGFVGIPLFAISAALSGAAICRHRTRNTIGWLLIANGLVASVSILSIALLPIAVDDGWPWALRLLLAQVVLTVWSAWLVLVPLVLLAFPSGRFTGIPTRVIAWAAIASWLLLEVGFLADPAPWTGIADFGVAPDDPLVTSPALGALATSPLAPAAAALEGIGFALLGIVALGTAAALIARWVRGDAVVRRQLTWVLIAAASAALVLATSALPLLLGPELGAPLTPAVFALVPAGIAVAIARGDALGMRRVFARTLSWIFATSIIVAAFAAIVTLLTGVLTQGAGSVLAAIAVALAFEPLRRALQRLADRVALGPAPDAAEALGAVGAGLSTTPDLDDVLQGLRNALRLDWLAVRLDEHPGTDAAPRPPAPESGLLGASGTPAEHVGSVPLRFADRSLGALEYGDPLHTTDVRRALTLLAPVVAALVELTLTTHELADSRGELVREGERERRRIQRDLHDGVSSTVAGIALKIEGIRLLAADAAGDGEVARLLEDVHGDIRSVSTALRSVIEDLAPPELELLGLDGAIRRAVSTPSAAPAVALTVAPEGRWELPAAVELAAYRIVVEAVTNSRRHAHADSIQVDLVLRDGDMRIRVEDRGLAPSRQERRMPGVGLESMKHRAEMLGGVLDAGPTGEGWSVRAVIPVGRHV